MFGIVNRGSVNRGSVSAGGGGGAGGGSVHLRGIGTRLVLAVAGTNGFAPSAASHREQNPSPARLRAPQLQQNCDARAADGAAGDGCASGGRSTGLAALSGQGTD